MAIVSVIIPVYNVEKYLKDCLDSVCKQSLKDIEIICINDGSTDNSLKILQQFAQEDRRIVILDQENQGLSVARNEGIRVATGKYLGFVDSDDWIDKDFYEKLVEAAEKYEADIAAAGVIYDTGKKKKRLIEYKKSLCVDHNLTKKCKALRVPTYNYVWNKIYKRELILKTKNFFMSGVCWEDMIWTSNLLEHVGKICCVPLLFYHYRYNEGSITSIGGQSSKKMADFKRACLYQTEWMRSHQVKLPFPVLDKLYVCFFGVRIFKIVRTAVAYDIFLFSKFKILTIQSKIKC